MQKLSSTKPAPAAKKVGDLCLSTPLEKWGGEACLRLSGLRPLLGKTPWKGTWFLERHLLVCASQSHGQSLCRWPLWCQAGHSPATTDACPEKAKEQALVSTGVRLGGRPSLPMFVTPMGRHFLSRKPGHRVGMLPAEGNLPWGEGSGRKISEIWQKL